MRQGARLAAAIEVLTDVEARHRPAADALRDWGISHRFAGSKDRSEIGDLVFGALRWRASSAFRMGDDSPRAWVLGAERFGFETPTETIASWFESDPHAPEALTSQELKALDQSALSGAAPWVAGDYPEWLDDELAGVFGEARAEEGAALASPAPLDIRVNTLKSDRDRVLRAIGESPKLKTNIVPIEGMDAGARIAWSRGTNFPFASEQAFLKGWFEVQDAGSQMAAAFADAKPGLQVADICAGGGGKTLALAAAMENKGQLFAFDVDGRRLAAVNERVARAGVRNVQIRAPSKVRDVLEDLHARMDIVFVDAPCSGSGTWRRAPDSKWRLKPAALDARLKEQQEALAMAVPLVKPGGRIIYVTCSVLNAENDGAIETFLAAHPQFTASAPKDDRGLKRKHGLQMSPRLTGTDGFYVSILTQVST
jgi:16S rRNA (cytosine967-C5)-methyltransferase